MDAINLKRKSRIKLLPLLLSFGEKLPPLTAVLGMENEEKAISLSMDAATVQSVAVVGDEEHSPQPLLRVMLTSLSMTNTPKVMRLALVNLGSSVRCCAQFPHLWSGRASSPELAAELLDQVLSQIERRALTRKPYPALIVAIDELLDCNLASVGKVIECGPSVGIYVLAATTRPDLAQALDFGVTVDVTKQASNKSSAVSFQPAWISPMRVKELACTLRTGIQTESEG